MSTGFLARLWRIPSLLHGSSARRLTPALRLFIVIFSLRRAALTRTDQTIRTKAYQIVRDMNNELKDQGYLTINGKCPLRYFQQKFYGLEIGGDPR